MFLNLTKIQKLAILLTSLPGENAAQMMREFKEEEAASISAEMSRLPNISPELRKSVLEEFLTEKKYKFSTPIISNPLAFGYKEKIKDLPEEKEKPLDFLKNISTEKILGIIKTEHPQTIALIMTYLDAKKVSEIIKKLHPWLRKDIQERLKKIQKIEPDILDGMEYILYNRLKYTLDRIDYDEVDGRESLIDILSVSDKSTEDKILKGISRGAGSLKKKDTSLEKIESLEKKEVKLLLHLTRTKDLMNMLKGSDKKTADKLYRCMEPDSRKAIEKEIKEKEIEEKEIKGAKEKIKKILQSLMGLGKIKFS